MRKNEDGSLAYELQAKYDFRLHILLDIDNSYWEIYCCYQVVKVFTNMGTEILALKFLPNTDLPFGLEKGQYCSLNRNIQVLQDSKLILDGRNDYNYNCHGLSFLNGEFYIDSNDEINKILNDDFIQVENPSSQEDIVIIHKDNNCYNHSAIYDFQSKIYKSKNGLNKEIACSDNYTDCLKDTNYGDFVFYQKKDFDTT